MNLGSAKFVLTRTEQQLVSKLGGSSMFEVMSLRKFHLIVEMLK